MDEENKNQNQNPAAETNEQAADTAEQPAVETTEPVQEDSQPAKEEPISFTKFEMPSFFAMLISLGLYTCSAMLIMALAQV